uniref:cAMP-dependent protein kinase inhibitor beta n=1 Tax=Cyprinus carpio TaxID=7962 RepID=A0A8C1P2K4_CYPCA
MTEVEGALDFVSSGRSGRRNALPDILGSPAGVSPSDLPLKLAELSLTETGMLKTPPHLLSNITNGERKKSLICQDMCSD